MGTSPASDGKESRGTAITVAIIAALAAVAAAIAPVVLRNWRKAPELSTSLEVYALSDDDRHSVAAELPIEAAQTTNMQVWVKAPAHLKTTLFWIDTQGKVFEYPLLTGETLNDGMQRFVWPATNSTQPIGGPAGTEIVFACSAEKSSPSIGDLALGKLASSWPSLPARAMVRFDANDISYEEERGPRDAPSSDAMDTVRELQARLSGRVKTFAGVVFSRVEADSGSDVAPPSAPGADSTGGEK